MRIWKRPQSIAVLFAMAALGAIGCSNNDAPMSPKDTPSPVFSQSEITYELLFVSRVYEGGQTTFTYHLNGVEECVECGPPYIAYPTDIMVELPECTPAPVAFSPPDGATIYQNVQGVYGIEWGLQYDDNPTYTYTITFDGDIAAGDVQGIVRRESSIKTDTITGPANRYEISGTVFTDTNQDNIQDAYELGIPNATITLDGGEITTTTTTDAVGNYAFSVCPGSYEVRLDPSTPANDVNESLVADFEPMGPASYEVTVGPNTSTGNDFGFEPDVEAILEALEDGEIETNGKSYKFWRKEVFLALIGLDEFGVYSKEELLGFIQDIQEIALLDEYEFTPGRELWEVFLILNNHATIQGVDNLDPEAAEISINSLEGDERSMAGLPTQRGNPGDEEDTFFHHPHNPYGFLLRELLTTEFNHVSGRGILSRLDLQELLIRWGEGVLRDNAPEEELELKAGGPIEALENPLEDAGKTFRGLNGATGGGGSN